MVISGVHNRRCNTGPRLTAKEIERQTDAKEQVGKVRPLTQGEFYRISKLWRGLDVGQKIDRFNKAGIFVAEVRSGQKKAGRLVSRKDEDRCGRKTGARNFVLMIRKELYSDDYAKLKEPRARDAASKLISRSLAVFRHEIAHVGQLQGVFDANYARKQGKKTYQVKVGNKSVTVKNDYHWKPEIQAGVPFNKLGHEDQASYVEAKTKPGWPRQPGRG